LPVSDATRRLIKLLRETIQIQERHIARLEKQNEGRG